MTKHRIWIDQDNVLYNFKDIWCEEHNKEYPNHLLLPEHIITWDTQAVCNAAGCNADVYKYFNDPKVWSDGGVLDGAKEVVDKWHKDDIADLGILTTAANGMSMPYKIEWLNREFPYIKDILVVYKAHIKHLVKGDIMIDDGIHNLEHFEGVRILYNQPWNQESGLPRANNWIIVDRMVRDAIDLLTDDYQRAFIETILKSRYNSEE